MPTATESSFYVPTVDIAPYLADPSSPAAEQILNDIRRACQTTGFFQIVGHGISRQLQQSIFDAAASFFALPFDEKKKLDAKTTIGHRGYDVLASQSYEDDVLPDLKEVRGISSPNPSFRTLINHFLQKGLLCWRGHSIR